VVRGQAAADPKTLTPASADIILVFHELVVHDPGLTAELPQATWGGPLLLFFAALFVLMRGLETTGVAVLLWTPVIPTLAEPARLWLVVAVSSTFAGNLLLIGSMANLVVAERAAARGEHLGFLEFARAGAPIALLSVAWGLLWLA
jgi:Na+/H+ antiporter NhaD/arsenite permease-like protein